MQPNASILPAVFSQINPKGRWRRTDDPGEGRNTLAYPLGREERALAKRALEITISFATNVVQRIKVPAISKMTLCFPDTSPESRESQNPIPIPSYLLVELSKPSALAPQAQSIRLRILFARQTAGS